MMQRMSHAQLLAALDRVLELCRQIGLAKAVEASRFLKYRRQLQWLIDLPSRRHTEDAASTTPQDMRFLATAQAESLELAGLADFLETCTRSILKPKLRDILRGPLVPFEEDRLSNKARNIMFELNLAEKLWRAHLQPELGEHPDVQCVVNGTTLLIECKRPLSTRGVVGCIGEARKQLKRELHGRPYARGIIAVSLSKTHEGDTFLAYTNEGRVGAFLGDELERLAQQAEAAEQELPSSIIGMLYHFMTPAQHRETALPVLAEQLNFKLLTEHGTADYRAMQGLHTAVATASTPRQ
jgi:hypothetical protein